MAKTTRMTRQKKIILSILKSTKSHPPAEWVYEQARKQLPDISLGTVYRNLKLLSDTGEIMELNYGSAFSRYDGNPADHYHFVCEQCGQVFDLELPWQEDLNIKAKDAKKDFDVKGHRLEFYGLCEKCKTKQQ